MIVKKIVDLCKKSCCVYLYEADGVQWISDGYCMFPLYGMPHFDEEAFFRTFDITEKKQEKIIFRHEMNLPENLCFDDHAVCENACEEGELLIGGSGTDGLIPYMTSQGIMFIDRKRLSPLADTPDGMLEIYERISKSGQIYFAAKSGFMLLGLITPYDAINERFVENLKSLYRQCEIALFNKNERKKEQTEQRTMFDGKGEGEPPSGSEEAE